MEAQRDGCHEIGVKGQSLVANDNLPEEVEDRDPSVVLAVKLVENIWEFDCRGAEWIVSGLQVR